MFGRVVLVALMAGVEGRGRGRSFLQGQRICREASEEQELAELRKVAAGFYDGSSVCFLTAQDSAYPHLDGPDSDGTADHGAGRAGRGRGGKGRARRSVQLRFEVNQQSVAAQKHIFVPKEESITCPGPQLALTFVSSKEVLGDTSAPTGLPRRLKRGDGQHVRPSLELTLSQRAADTDSFDIELLCSAPLKIPDPPDSSAAVTADNCAAEELQCQGEYFFSSPDGSVSRKSVKMECRPEDWTFSEWPEDLPACDEPPHRRLLVV